MEKPQRKIDFELLARVKRMPCCLCSGHADPAHIWGRGAGGPDEEWNVIPLCRKHHTEQHQKGWVKFLEKHFALKWKLEQAGWVIRYSTLQGSRTGRLWHPNMASTAKSP